MPPAQYLFYKILGELCVRLKMPVIIGEIITGMLLGTYVLGVIDTSNSVLMSFAEIGVIFLMFYVGLEIRVKDLFAVGRTAILVGLLGVIFPLLIGFGSMILLGFEIVESLFVATAILTTSVGISVKVLHDKDLIKHKFCRVGTGHRDAHRELPVHQGRGCRSGGCAALRMNVFGPGKAYKA